MACARVGCFGSSACSLMRTQRRAAGVAVLGQAGGSRGTAAGKPQGKPGFEIRRISQHSPRKQEWLSCELQATCRWPFVSYLLHLAIPIASPSTAHAPAPTTPHQSRPGSADAMFPPPSLAPCAPPSAPPPCDALPGSVLPDEVLVDADAEADAELAELDESGSLNAPAVPVVLEEANNGSFLFDAVEGSNLSAASIACRVSE